MSRKLIQSIFSLFFLLAVILGSASCSGNKKKQEHASASATSAGLTPPQRVLAGKPVVADPKSCQPAKVIVVPTGPTNETRTYKNGTVVHLGPPTTTPADFFVEMENYTTEQGLPISAVSCGYQDRQGNLWFGLPGGGLTRYDGKTFATYTTEQGLASNNVLCVKEDRGGNLWIGTEGGGVSRYDGNTFTTFSTVQGLPNNLIKGILVDRKGDVWLGTSGGICRYDGKTFVTYTTAQGLSNNSVTCLMEDKKGNLWFGTQGGGVNRYDGKSFVSFTKAMGLPSNNVFSICQDDKGKIWLGSTSGLVCGLEENGTGAGRTKITSYNLGSAQIRNIVINIIKDKRGNVWFATTGSGAFRYDGKTFTTFSSAQGLSNEDVWSITEDKRGNLWFGTYGGGLNRYDGNAFTSFSTAQGLSNNNVFSIGEDKKGDLWFGTDGGGVSRFDGEFFTTFGIAQGLADNNVFCITRDKKENLWFGTLGGGVCCFDGKTFSTYGPLQGLSDFTVSSIAEDKNGNLWFGTQKGLSFFDGKSMAVYTTAQGLPGNVISCITRDRHGDLWFGTQGNGVCHYDGTYFTNYTTAQGLSNNTVWCITEDRNGNLWFGTDGGGANVLSSETADKLALHPDKVKDLDFIFRTISTDEGLAENTVSNISEGKEGKMYLGTNKGISVLAGWKTDAANEPTTSYPKGDGAGVPVFETYNKHTGYPIKDVNVGQRAMFIDSKGIVWAGTGDDKTALVRFSPADLNRNAEVPHVYIQAIKLNDENICWLDLKETGVKEQNKPGGSGVSAAGAEEVSLFGKKLNEAELDTLHRKYAGLQFDSVTKFSHIPQKLVLPYEHNNITFDFLAIDPAKSSLINYQYILEGYDKGWSRVSPKTSATFGNIFEGTYTFKLRAQNPEGVWGDPIAYTFKVKAPWYRTVWLYLVYILMAFLLFLGIYYWRTAALRIRQKQLEDTVVERTAEVEEQKKEIIDSINYARRLQQALLPSLKSIRSNLPESFVLYRPKAIVAGDFYWMHTTGDILLIAAGDCTGHGVPGALVSIVCSNALNRTVNEFGLTDTGKILDKVTDLVMENFEKSGEEINDGMDISLLSINKASGQIQWSGANNPLWIFRGTVLEEIKADKQPVGKTEKRKPFTSHNRKLVKGETFYLITDGYADQFGKGDKKLMKSKFKDLLAVIQGKTMDEQFDFLNNHHIEWKGKMEQTDDVTIIGIRI